jgi:hypothetical protein
MSKTFSHNSYSQSIGTLKPKGREFNRPQVNQPERHCPCGRGYRYAWGWLLTIPAHELIDLCSRCTRVLRYGSATERRELAEMLTSANGEWRLCA